MNTVKKIKVLLEYILQILLQSLYFKICVYTFFRNCFFLRTNSGLRHNRTLRKHPCSQPSQMFPELPSASMLRPVKQVRGKAWRQIFKSQILRPDYTQARTCGFALDVFVASVLETLATTTGDALGRKPDTFILGSPMSSNVNDPVEIYMISLLIPSIINGFLIGVSEYLMNVLHAVWIYFHTLQERLDQVDKAFRLWQLAIIFVFRSFISQTKHMASKNSTWPVSDDSGRENSLHVFKSWKHWTAK